MKKFTLASLLITFLIFSSSILSSYEGNGEILIPVDALDLSLAGGIASDNALGASTFNPSLITLGNAKYFVRFSYFSGIFDNTGIQDFRIGGNPIAGLSLMLNVRMYKCPDFAQVDEWGQVWEWNYNVPSTETIRFAVAYDIAAGFRAGFEIMNYQTAYIYTNGDSRRKDIMFPSLGVSWIKGNYSLGLALQYIDLIYSGDELESAPTSINFQAGAKFMDEALRFNLIFSQNVERESDNMRIGLGAEYCLMDMAYLRLAFVGYSELMTGLNAGIGIKYRGVDVDYNASITKSKVLHHLSLGYGFGQKKEIVKEEKPKRVKKAKKQKFVTKKKKKKGETAIRKPLEKMLVAVLDFEGKNMEKSDAGIITDFVSQEMLNSGYFKVLERGAINDIMSEVNFQQSGCTSAECAVQIGKILAVKKMVVGSVSKLGKKFFITVRMVDVETSQIDLATSIGANVPLEELPGHVGRLIDQMVEKLFAEEE
ncbi:hypothetical protein KAU32_09185 [bacterium]|nr:hypothetical protein [bacterium]